MKPAVHEPRHDEVMGVEGLSPSGVQGACHLVGWRLRRRTRYAHSQALQMAQAWPVRKAAMELTSEMSGVECYPRIYPPLELQSVQALRGETKGVREVPLYY